jgi:hypothetical protein
MTHRNAKIRPAMTAIAAVLALSSTVLVAQAAPEAAQPVVQAPPTPVTQAPAIPVTESAPVAPTASEPPVASDPIAPTAEPATTTTKASKSTATRRTASVARPVKAAPRVARAPVAAPVAAPTPTVEAAPTPLVAPPAASPLAVAATPPVQEAPAASNNMLPIAGAAGLVLLALIGLWVAMRRRNVRREEEFAAVDQAEPAFEGPAPVDPLFAAQPSAPLAAAPAATAAEPATEGPCADAAPGSRVEAACEGPTEDNPSLSIKKRLKRAQFFDQREQLAAAGLAVPVEADAGLPDAVEAPEAATTRETA